MMETAAKILVLEKKFELEGREFLAQALRMEDGDYMTAQQAADGLGVTPSGVRSVISDHGLHCVRAADSHLAELKELGVIALRAPAANLLPKTTVRALVKILDTPQAWAAYAALWDASEELAELKAREAEREASRPLNSEELLRLRTAIAERCRMFAEPAYVRGQIDRDIRWVFFGKAAHNEMQLRDLPASKLDAALRMVGEWRKQLSPLTRRQVKSLDKWVNNTIAEAKRNPAPYVERLDTLAADALGEEQA